jgi:hypothetical protein
MQTSKPLSAGERVKYTAEFLRRMALPQNAGKITAIENNLARVLWRGENVARLINLGNIERAKA